MALFSIECRLHYVSEGLFSDVSRSSSLDVTTESTAVSPGVELSLFTSEPIAELKSYVVAAIIMNEHSCDCGDRFSVFDVLSTALLKSAV